MGLVIDAHQHFWQLDKPFDYEWLRTPGLEKICRDREDLVEQIQITVRHEIGHHLGLSEEDMERLGLA